jgi:lactate/malate dehydrogenase, NAD binding domain
MQRHGVWGVSWEALDVVLPQACSAAIPLGPAPGWSAVPCTSSMRADCASVGNRLSSISSAFTLRFGCKVRPAEMRDAGQAEVVIITAGAKQKEGESRGALLERNQSCVTLGLSLCPALRWGAVRD